MLKVVEYTAVQCIGTVQWYSTVVECNCHMQWQSTVVKCCGMNAVIRTLPDVEQSQVCGIGQI